MVDNTSRKSLNHDLDLLQEVRQHTLQVLAKRGDWLYETSFFPNGRQTNRYVKWFHVVEEVRHVGQIVLIKKYFLENHV